MSVTVNDRYANVVVVFMLTRVSEIDVSNNYPLTEYEFSPSSDDPVATMLGE